MAKKIEKVFKTIIPLQLLKYENFVRYECAHFECIDKIEETPEKILIYCIRVRVLHILATKNSNHFVPLYFNLMQFFLFLSKTNSLSRIFEKTCHISAHFRYDPRIFPAIFPDILVKKIRGLTGIFVN